MFRRLTDQQAYNYLTINGVRVVVIRAVGKSTVRIIRMHEGVEEYISVVGREGGKVFVQWVTNRFIYTEIEPPFADDIRRQFRANLSYYSIWLKQQVDPS